MSHQESNEIAIPAINFPAITNAEIVVPAVQYYPDHTFEVVDATITEAERVAMDMVFQLGSETLQKGNPPIGAVIVDNSTGLRWGASTIDKSNPTVLGHAEVRVYREAEHALGDDLHDCSLVSMAQLCSTCTPPYAEGKVGRIVFGATRPDVYKTAGIMRPRLINMHELLLDGATETLVIGGYRAEEALTLFGIWEALYNKER
jgi:tRNA(Arg) A34 adenosine deaminase TadA